MAKTSLQNGQCLCGVVQVAAGQASHSVTACHCQMCRRWAGGPWLAVACGTDVSFTGQQSIGVFHSSAWAERGFCRECGSSLYYRLKQAGTYYLNAGLFDDYSGAVFDHQVFIDEKPDYYAFANQTHNMTGAELLAQLSGE